MAKSLHKVQKQVSKKRGGKPTSLHENSRDSQRLRAAGAREDKVARLLAAATRANQTYGQYIFYNLVFLSSRIRTLVERIAFFQSALADISGSVTADEMQTLTAGFIGRDDEELDSLKAKRRPGRPPSSQEDRLRHRRDDELREYKSGFWIPELRDEESRSRLERWNGEWAALNTLTFVRIFSGGGIKPSSFPPKGLS